MPSLREKVFVAFPSGTNTAQVANTPGMAGTAVKEKNEKQIMAASNMYLVPIDSRVAPKGRWITR